MTATLFMPQTAAARVSDVQVAPVRSWRDRRDFMQLAWRLYEGNPNWVPPLRCTPDPPQLARPVGQRPLLTEDSKADRNARAHGQPTQRAESRGGADETKAGRVARGGGVCEKRAPARGVGFFPGGGEGGRA